MRAVTVAVALALMLPVCAEAGGRSGGRGHASSGGGSHHQQHHHHHYHRGGTVFIGTGFYYGYPYYYGYPPYYYPPPVDYWYYCRAANAYHPYVQQCPGGWERYLPGTPLG